MDKRETVYIAGPITGIPDYHTRFTWAKYHLTRMGFRVLSPAVLPEGMTRSQYMRICFAMIDTADKVCFLPKWKESDGARLEYEYCRYIGKTHGFLEKIGGLSDAVSLEWRGENYCGNSS